MKNFSGLLALSMLAMTSTAAHAQAAASEKGKMLYGSGNVRLGSIYKVTVDGSAQIILDGRLVTVPGNTISTASGKVETSLTKAQLNGGR